MQIARPESPAAAAAATDEPLPRLAGMIVTPESKRALFILDGRTVAAAGAVDLSAQDRAWTLSLTGGPADPRLSLAAAALPTLPFWSTPCGRSHSRDRRNAANGGDAPAFPELCRAFAQAARE